MDRHNLHMTLQVSIKQLFSMCIVNIPLVILGRRQSEEHIAKSEILVHSARIANKVYVGDSSGEDSETMETMFTCIHAFIY